MTAAIVTEIGVGKLRLDPRTVKRGWGYADSGVHPPGSSGTSYAFPTSITSYTGLNGGGTALTAHLTWDYNIGKPLTTVNVNGYTTYYSYSASDGLNRLRIPTKKIAPSELKTIRTSPGDVARGGIPGSGVRLGQHRATGLSVCRSPQSNLARSGSSRTC